MTLSRDLKEQKREEKQRGKKIFKNIKMQIFLRIMNEMIGILVLSSEIPHKSFLNLVSMADFLMGRQL